MDGGTVVDGWRDTVVCAWACDGICTCACKCARRASTLGSDRSRADGTRLVAVATGGVCEDGWASACSDGDGEIEPSLALATNGSGTGAGDGTTHVSADMGGVTVA